MLIIDFNKKTISGKAKPKDIRKYGLIEASIKERE